MTGPLVSIILPTYNGSAYIKASIESCLRQTYQNIELIIVDDHSSDTTPDIIKGFAAKDNRIIYIRNEQNEKLPRSLNSGFEKAKGTYFTWTSDDNYYAPDAITTMVAILQEDPARGLVYANYTVINETGAVTGIKKFGDVNQNMVTWTGCGACFLYRSALHHELKGYDPSAFLIEDYDFFIRALTITKFFYLDRDDLYFYRLHSGSLTSLYGYYNFDLQKIVVERQLAKIFTIASKQEKIQWLRKYAVYYGVSKNNTKRMDHYLVELYRLSKGQAFVTVCYINFRKFVTGIQMGFHASWTFLRLIFGAKK